MIPIDPRYFVDPTPSAGARLGQILGLGGSAYATNLLRRRAYEKLGIPAETANLSPQVQSAYIKQSQKNKVAPLVLDLINKRQQDRSNDNYLLPVGQNPNPIQPSVSSLPGVPQIQPTATTSAILPGIPQPITDVDTQNNPILQPDPSITPQPQQETELERITLPPYIQKPIFSQDEISTLALADPKLAKVYQQQLDTYNSYIKDFTEKEQKQAQPVIDKSMKIGNELAQQQYGLDAMEGAVERGGRFAIDYLAQNFNIPFLGSPTFLASPAGKQLETVKKQFLFSDLEGIARPNLFIDRKAEQAYPQVGVSQAANLTTLEILRAKYDINSKYVDYTNEIVNEDKRKYGFVQGNLQERVNKRLTNYAKDRYKQTERRLIDINYPENVPFRMFDKKDNEYKYFVVPHNEVDNLLNQGAEPYDF